MIDPVRRRLLDAHSASWCATLFGFTVAAVTWLVWEPLAGVAAMMGTLFVAWTIADRAMIAALSQMGGEECPRK